MLQIEESQTDQIIKLLRKGAVVALPTETVYGLAALATHREAVAKLAQIKERDAKSGKFFTLVPESVDQIAHYAKLNRRAKQLIQRYFPGALTLILPKNQALKIPYFEQLDTIGLRLPDYPLFEQILPQVGPILLTSANRKGKAPLQDAKTIISHMPELDAVIVGQPGNQPPSTIIDCTAEDPLVIRQGALKVV